MVELLDLFFGAGANAPGGVLKLGPQGLPIRGLLEEQEAAPDDFNLAFGLEPLLKFLHQAHLVPGKRDARFGI